MSNPFIQTVQSAQGKTNVFDHTHDVKMSGKMGHLMPCCVVECVPGDTVDIGAETLARLMPLVTPVMHRFDIFVHYWFVPNRVVWENFPKFISKQSTGGIPYIEMNATLTAEQKKLADYLGIPPCPPGATPVNVNAIPFAAYQCIYDYMYRDQNLIAEVDWHLTDGNNNVNRSTLCTLRKSAYEHDYFTSCLPTAQYGSPVDMPMGDVVLKSSWDTYGTPQMKRSDGTVGPDGPIEQQGGDIKVVTGGGPDPNVAYDPEGTLTVGATLLSQFRLAIRLQEYREALMRFGRRVNEFIKGMFGVDPGDARIQQPEYIAGVKNPVVISEVLNTTGEDGGLPQGNMAGHGVAVGSGYTGSYFCREHGYVIGIVRMLPKTSYTQGIPKHFLKTDAFDYLTPQFTHVGEQPVKNNELYAYTPSGNGTFGYLPIYSDYRMTPSRVAGDMRTTLYDWHCARIFNSLPTLSQEFVEVDPEDVLRVFAFQGTEDNVIINVLNRIRIRRQLPVYGQPMI